VGRLLKLRSESCTLRGVAATVVALKLAPVGRFGCAIILKKHSDCISKKQSCFFIVLLNMGLLMAAK
jgi:hypothetical protein